MDEQERLDRPDGVAPRERALPEVTLRSEDVDEARSVAGAVYYPHRVGILGDSSRFRMWLEAVDVGPALFGWMRYDTEVQVETGTLDTAYQVNIVTAGQLETASGSERIIANPNCAAVYRPDRDTVMKGWGFPTPMAALKFSRPAMEQELENLIERPVRKPIAFRTGLDISSGRGRQWWSLVEELAAHIGDDDALVRQRHIAPSLAHSVMTGLLLAGDHDYREELDAPVRPAVPRAVCRAMEFIDANADQPLTVAAAAAEAGVGIRALQQGFRQALGTSPIRYLRDVRLRGAHRDLLKADPQTTSVATIALRWSFSHLGRFAQLYRQAYGTSPSHTLRSANL